MNYGLNQVGGSGRRTQRDLGLLDKQLRAFGTTMRYAFAGAVTFGILNQAQALGEYYDQVSRIAGLLPASTDIQRFSETLGRAGVEAGIGFTEMTGGARALLGILPDLERVPNSGKVVTDITTELAKSTTLLETNADELAKGIGTTLSPENIIDPAEWRKELARQFQLVSATQFSGADLATYLGQISPIANVLGVQRPTLFALLETMARGGGTAAINIRHLRQLMTQIASPSKEAAEKLSDLGLTQDVRTGLLSQRGGFEAIIRQIITAARKRGLKVEGRVTEEQMLAAEEALASGDISAAATMAGMQGSGATFLLDLLGRVEAGRALATIAQQTAPDRGGFQVLTDLEATYANQTQLLKNLQDAQQRTINQRFFQQMTEQMAEFRRSVFRDLEPASRAFAGFIRDMFSFGAEHPLAALGGVGGGILGLLGLQRILRGRGLPGGGLLGRLLGRGRALAGPAAVAGMQVGGQPPVGTFGDPIWVMVHPLSPGGGGPGGILGGGAGGKGRIGRILKKFPGLGRMLGGLGLLGGIAGIAGMELAFPDDANTPMLPELEALWNANPRAAQQFQAGNRAPWNKIVTAHNRAANQARLARMTPEQRRAFEAATGGPDKGGAVYGQIANAIQKSTSQISSIVGKDAKEVLVQLEATEELRRLVKIKTTVGERAHVPAAGWQGGAIPTSRGRKFQTIRNAT